MGLGSSIVTAICLTEADRERLAARSLARWFPRRSYGVVMRKGKYLSPQARAFVDLIKPDLFTREHDASGHSARSRGRRSAGGPASEAGPSPGASRLPLPLRRTRAQTQTPWLAANCESIAPPLRNGRISDKRREGEEGGSS